MSFIYRVSSPYPTTSAPTLREIQVDGINTYHVPGKDSEADEAVPVRLDEIDELIGECAAKALGLARGRCLAR